MIWVSPLGDDLGEPPGGGEHREGRDERRDPPVGDEHPVDQAAAGADGERGEHHDDPVGVGGHRLRRQGGGPDAATGRRSAPTERSMPPPPMTNVIPMLTTPMTEARRRMVIALSTLAKRSPAVMTPTMHEQQQGDDQAQVAAGRARHEGRDTGGAWRTRLGGQGRGVARRPHRQVVGHRRPTLGVRGLLGRPDTHAASPLMMMSSTWCSSSWSAWASCSTSPSPTTRTRSDRPSTSSISLDTTTTATPSSASRRMRA